MGTKMTLTARAELTSVVRRRYLDEFIAVTGYHNKSAIRALNAEPAIKRRQIQARPSLYDEAARAALIVMWEASDRICESAFAHGCRFCCRRWSAMGI